MESQVLSIYGVDSAAQKTVNIIILSHIQAPSGTFRLALNTRITPSGSGQNPKCRRANIRGDTCQWEKAPTTSDSASARDSVNDGVEGCAQAQASAEDTPTLVQRAVLRLRLAQKIRKQWYRWQCSGSG